MPKHQFFRSIQSILCKYLPIFSQKLLITTQITCVKNKASNTCAETALQQQAQLQKSRSSLCGLLFSEKPRKKSILDTIKAGQDAAEVGVFFLALIFKLMANANHSGSWKSQHFGRGYSKPGGKLNLFNPGHDEGVNEEVVAFLYWLDHRNSIEDAFRDLGTSQR